MEKLEHTLQPEDRSRRDTNYEEDYLTLDDLQAEKARFKVGRK